MSRALAAAAVAAATAVAHAPPASAAPAWQATAARSTGSVGMATWGFAFAGVSGAGTGGQSYTHRNLLLGDTTLVDLTNTGGVPLRLSGTITMTTVLGGSISIRPCPPVTSGQPCPAGPQLLASLTVLGTTVVPVDYAGGSALAPGTTTRLQVELKGGIGNQVRLTAVPVRRAAVERTWT